MQWNLFITAIQGPVKSDRYVQVAAITGSTVFVYFYHYICYDMTGRTRNTLYICFVCVFY